MKKQIRFKKPSSAFLWWLLGGLIFIVILIFLYPEKDKIIQSELVLVLIGITFYYAKQTRRQLKLGEQAREDERKKESARFAEKKLEEFYNPFSLNLSRLRTKIVALTWQNYKTDWKEADDFLTEEINPLLVKYEYLCPKEAVGLLTILDLFEQDTKELKEGEEEKFYSSKQEVSKTLDSIQRNIYRKCHDCIDKINKVYGFFEPADLEASRQIMALHKKAKEK